MNKQVIISCIDLIDKQDFKRYTKADLIKIICEELATPDNPFYCDVENVTRIINDQKIKKHFIKRIKEY